MTYYAESNGDLNGHYYCDLWRFPSKKGRDAWVDAEYRRNVITARDAAKRHPDQFRGRFENGYYQRLAVEINKTGEVNW